MVVLRKRSLELLIPKIFGRSHHDDPYDIDLRLNSSFSVRKTALLAQLGLVITLYHPLPTRTRWSVLTCWGDRASPKWRKE